jgi:hypothetical protein
MKQVEPIEIQLIFLRKEKKKLSRKFWDSEKSFYLCTRFWKEGLKGISGKRQKKRSLEELHIRLKTKQRIQEFCIWEKIYGTLWYPFNRK